MKNKTKSLIKQSLCKIFTKRFCKDFTLPSSTMPTHAKNTFTGDICAPEGFLFSLECKNGHEDKIDLGNIFTSKNKTLDGFLKQSIKEANDCNRLPMVCWKRKRRPWVAFIREADLDLAVDFNSHMVYWDWIAVSLDKLLEFPDDFFFKESNG